MKSKSFLKRIGAVLLGLSLLCGMLLTGVVLPATAAEEAEATAKPFSFTVKDIIPFSGGKYVIGGKAANAWYDFTSATVAESVTIRTALDTNFDLFYNNKDHYAKIPFGANYSGDPNGASASFKTVYENNWLQRGGISSKYETTSDFDVITTVVPKVDGEYLVYKNFETTFYFDHETTASAAILGFRQQTPGKFVNADGELNKEQGFVVVSKNGITFGAGSGITDDMYTTYTESFSTATVRQLAITVKVVNNKMTVRVTNVAGTTVYFDNTDNPLTINYELAGTLAYGVTRAKGDLGSISLTYLDGSGNPKDFDTTLKVEKYRADITEAVNIANDEGKFASANAISLTAEDTAIQAWFNSKFAGYFNRETAEYCALDYIGQKSSAFQTDTGSPKDIYWALEKSTQSLRFTRETNYANQVLRKSMTLALKTADGSLAKLKNFEAEVDFIVPASAGRGGVFLSFREKEPGRMQVTSAGAFNKDFCGDAVVVSDREVDGVIPGNLQDRTNAHNAIAYENDKKLITDSAHTLYVKVVGNKLIWKVTKIDSQTIIGQGRETLTRDLPAGYISVGCSSQNRKLLDIRVTALDDSGEAIDFNGCNAYDFSVKNVIPYSNSKYVINGAATNMWWDFTGSQAEVTTIKNFLNSNVDLFYNNKAYYSQIPFGSTHSGDPDGSSASFKTLYANDFLQRGGITSAYVVNSDLEVITAMVPKVNGEYLSYKNFEATFCFDHNDTGASAVFGFRQQTPGKFVDAAGVINKEQGFVTVNANGVTFGAGNDITTEMYTTPTATFSSAAARKMGITVKVVNNKLTVKVFGLNSNLAPNGTVYYDNSANPATINFDKAGTLAYGVGRKKADLGAISIIHLDENGAPVSYKVNDENEPEHVCDFAEAKYDENNHWNECECGEKADVTAHSMTAMYDADGEWTECACGYKTEKAAHKAVYAHDADGHWTVCACGYQTEKAAHNFAEDMCACGEQKPNTAVVDADARLITLKAEEGYQLKVGSLVVTDANNVSWVPTRVGYRENGDATQYTIPAAAVAPFAVEAEFIQPGAEEGFNVGFLGSSINAERGGLRFVHHVEIDKDGYMLYDGEKVKVAEYGLLVASAAILPNAGDLDLETAEDSMHVHRIKWGCADGSNKYYDRCDNYAQVSVQVVNIPVGAARDLQFHTRAYIVLADDTVVYMSPVTNSYNGAQ